MSKVNAVGQEQARIAIGNASRTAGVDFTYLLAQAKIESGLNSAAKAATSSAAGLFQFTKSTWLGMLERHGDAYGVGWASTAISQTAGGGLKVQDPLLRQNIMALRHDPALSSVMAAEFAKENGAALRPVLGREPDHAELYLAHFLGAGGASQFIAALQSDPGQTAAGLLPEAAAANRPIFYTKDGSARSIANVMDLIRTKVEAAKLDAAEHYDGTPVRGFGASFSLPPIAREFAASGTQTPPLAGNSRKPMSAVLLEAFGDQGSASGISRAKIKNAYAKLQGFGL